MNVPHFDSFGLSIYAGGKTLLRCVFRASLPATIRQLSRPLSHHQHLLFGREDVLHRGAIQHKTLQLRGNCKFGLLSLSMFATRVEAMEMRQVFHIGRAKIWSCGYYWIKGFGMETFLLHASGLRNNQLRVRSNL